MSTQQISDAEYAVALAAGGTEAEIEIRAQAVRYVSERDAIEIVTNRNAGWAKQALDDFEIFGAGNEARTRDLNLGKVALYQLSYSRTVGKAES